MEKAKMRSYLVRKTASLVAPLSSARRRLRAADAHLARLHPYLDPSIKRVLPAAGLIGLLAVTSVSIPGAQSLAQESGAQQDSSETEADWKGKWAVEEGFSLSIDTEGYHYPTAIAFVPEPGPDPKDPLYFVTEVRGTIKVVTNDRTVYTFAEDFLQTEFGNDLAPRQKSEFGLAGICLEPKRGYVFVTFAYQEEDKTLRNNIVRFDTTPETFALNPKSQRAFTEVFAPYETSTSHQIGGCQVSNDMLYVGVGDGINWMRDSQRKDSLRGKIIRMTLDGKPVADNPFYVDNDIHKATNYVLALGVRNPFALEVVGDRAFMAENGWGHDRFYEVVPGKNYLWNGSDDSIAANADYVFLEAMGPVHMDYYERMSPAFPDRFKDQFYLALSSIKATAGIMRVPYGLEEKGMVGVPEYFLKPIPSATEWATGNEQTWVTGVAFGPDGLYFSPLMPVRNDQGAVMKLSYDPDNAHGITLQDLETQEIKTADSQDMIGLMRRKGCFGCHALTGVWEGGMKGPALGGDPMIERIQQRINSPQYLQWLQELDRQDKPPYNRYEKARDSVAKAQGMERVRTYIHSQILEPRFDGPSSMPNLELTELEAQAITRYLMSGESHRGFLGSQWADLSSRLFKTEERRLFMAYAGGMLTGGVLIGLVLSMVVAWLARRRARHS